jgi:DNA polymerase alpha subunit B
MHERLRYLSNPCTFSVNEIVIGVTATDVLFHLSKEEVFKQSEGVRTDRLGRLANHLIEQRSFYPLYPPAMEVNLETSRIDKLEMACTPDILILPSDMKFFAKIVNDSLAVNPGRLTKALSAGTYCQISVAGIDRSHGVKSAGVLRC